MGLGMNARQHTITLCGCSGHKDCDNPTALLTCREMGQALR